MGEGRIEVGGWGGGDGKYLKPLGSPSPIAPLNHHTSFKPSPITPLNHPPSSHYTLPPHITRLNHTLSSSPLSLIDNPLQVIELTCPILSSPPSVHRLLPSQSRVLLKQFEAVPWLILTQERLSVLLFTAQKSAVIISNCVGVVWDLTMEKTQKNIAIFDILLFTMFLILETRGKGLLSLKMNAT